MGKIGKTLQEIRKLKGITQQDLANQVGISRRSLSFIESDISLPHSETLRKLCEALEISEPILRLASLDKEDVAMEKREKFEEVFPAIEIMLRELFLTK